MGLFSWSRRPKARASVGSRQHMNLAFVLLREAKLPDPKALADAFLAFAEPGDSLQIESHDVGADEQGKVVSLRLKTGASCMLALMPVPVPKGEADDGAKFSLSAFRDGWTLPAHAAHLVVTYHDRDVEPAVIAVSRFTSVLATVAEVSGSVGIYWGGSGATHDAEFFASVAREQGIIPRIMVWTGISIAREGDGRLSLLSLGMAQLSLPNLLLVSGEESADSALEVMFDLLAYIAERGKPIREGETVGMSEDQRLPVRYVESPVDPGVKVWRVELP